MATMGHFKKIKNKDKKWNECEFYYEGKIQLEDGTEEHIMLTENMMKYAKGIVKRNPEDIRKDSWLADMLD